MKNITTPFLALGLAAVAMLAILDAQFSTARAVTFTVTPSAVSNTYSGQITLTVAGLATGNSVVFQKFLDLNTDGVIDGNDWLVQQFSLTDGQAGMVIGGIVNSNVPGDTDTAAGNITAKLNFNNGDFMQIIAGKYLFKVSGNFTPPITNGFTVTNLPWPQKITGNVVSNGTSTTVANAVILLMPGPDSSPVAGVVANNAGSYTVPLPAGTYVPLAIRSNYLANFSTAPQITLGSLATITTNLTVTNATASIAGRIVDTANHGTGLPGILLPLKSTNGMMGIGLSDTNGDFAVGVRSGQWSFKPDEPGLTLHGYAGLRNGTNLNAGNTTFTSAVPKINALIYGSVKNVLGNPMAGVYVYIQPGPTNKYYANDGFTDANGNYVAGVVGGTNEIWFPTIPENENPNFTNYVFTQFTNYDFVQLDGNVSSNTAVLQNFLGMLATNHIYGSVKTSSGTNIAGVGVSASQNIGGANFWVWTHTITNGNYSLNVGNGTWDLSVYCSASGYGDDLDTILGTGNFVCPNDQYPAINNNNATNNFMVQPSGTNLVPSFASCSIAGSNLQIGVANGVAGKTYLLLAGTNLTQPLNQWMPVATNALSFDGNFTLTATNVVTPLARQKFFILQTQ